MGRFHSLPMDIARPLAVGRSGCSVACANTSPSPRSSRGNEGAVLAHEHSKARTVNKMALSFFAVSKFHQKGGQWRGAATRSQPSPAVRIIKVVSAFTKHALVRRG